MKIYTSFLAGILLVVVLISGCNFAETPTLAPIESVPTATAVPPTPSPSPTPSIAPTETLETVLEDPEETEIAPTQAPAGTAVIRGVVWHDICGTRENDAGEIEEAGPGCVIVEGRFQANGLREISEPGINGITVSLKRENCAVSDSAQTQTDSEGVFSFAELAAGTYCIQIDPNNSMNAGPLGNGTWTFGAETSDGTLVEVPDDASNVELSFGWDFVDLPVFGVSTCVEKASFVLDVTVPDDTLFRPGETFEKIWRVRNEGTCTWGTDYSLVFVSGDRFGAGSSQLFTSTAAPGQTIDLAMQMQAPGSGGTYISNWQFKDPSGRQFGLGVPATSFLWASIKVAFLDAGGNPPAATPPSGSQTGTGTCALVYDASIESQVIALINKERAAAGLPALSPNRKLTAAAQKHSADMAANDFIDHTGSDGSRWFGRIASEGYSYSYASENIYVGNPAFGGTAEGAVTWWMNSQVHRDNILSKAVEQIGVGYVFCGSSTYGGYYTVVFARP